MAGTWLPLLGGGMTVSTNESQAVTIEFSAWNEDLVTGAATPATPTYRIMSLPQNGTLKDSTGPMITSVPTDISSTSVIYTPYDTHGTVLPSTGFTDVFEWVTVDGGSESNTVPMNINVLPINDAPIITPETALYEVGDAPFTLTNAFSISDDSSMSTAPYNGVVEVVEANCGTISVSGITATSSLGNTRVEVTGMLSVMNGMSIQYTALSGRNQTCHVRLTVDDGGYSGSGGPRSGTSLVTIQASAVAVASMTTFVLSGFPSSNPHEGSVTVTAKDFLGQLRQTSEDVGYPEVTMWMSLSGSGVTEQIILSFSGSGQYVNSTVVLPTVGAYEIRVLLAQADVAGSPLVVNVPAGPIDYQLSSCVHIPAIAIEGDPTSFSIVPHDRYNNNRTTDCSGCVDKFEVTLSRGPVTCPYTRTYDASLGMYMFSFVAPTGGSYSLQVEYDGNVIPSCSAAITMYEVCSPGTIPLPTPEGCQECAKGEYSNVNTTYDPSVTPDCTQCAKGYYTDTKGQSECLPCSAGSYADVEGMEACKQCIAGEYQPGTGQDACIACPARTLSGEGSDNVAQCLCVPGSYFVAVGQACDGCPNGATCDGQDTLPYAKPGFWGTPSSAITFLPCVPAEACKGGATANSQGSCERGYGGRMCADCLMTATDRFYKLNEKCEECPENSTIMIIIICVVGVFAFAGMFKLQQTGIRFPSVTLMISFVQVTALFGRFNLNWPPEIETVFRYLSSFNFNIDLVAPECQVPLSFYQKWVTKMVFPMVFVGLFVITFAFAMVSEVLIKLCRDTRRKGLSVNVSRDVQPMVQLSPPSPIPAQAGDSNEVIEAGVETVNIPGTIRAEPQLDVRRASNASDAGLLGDKAKKYTSWDDDVRVTKPKPKLTRQQSSYYSKYNGLMQRSRRLADSLLNTGMTLLVILYTFLVTNTIDYFRCVTLPGETTSWMATQPSIQCYSDEYMANLPIAITAAALYGIGVPVLVIIVLVRAKRRLGDTIVRHRFGSLYNRYNPRYYFWELIVMLRKFAIAMIVVAIANDVLWQSVAGLLLCFLFLVLQLYAAPFELRSNNRLEAAGLITSYLTLFAGLLFFTANMAGVSQLVLTWFIVVIIVGSMAAFAIGVVWEVSGVFRRKWKKDKKMKRVAKGETVMAMAYVSEEEMIVLQRLFPRGDRDVLAQLVNNTDLDRDTVMDFCRRANNVM